MVFIPIDLAEDSISISTVNRRFKRAVLIEKRECV